MDKLEIIGLNVMTQIGVYAWEQKILQPLLIDIIIPTDFTNCNEQLVNTIDYATVAQSVTSFVNQQSFQLIETVAEKVSALIKKEFAVQKLTIKVCKPHAIANAQNVCVTLER